MMRMADLINNKWKKKNNDTASFMMKSVMVWNNSVNSIMLYLSMTSRY
jgi:hypothetical protein